MDIKQLLKKLSKVNFSTFFILPLLDLGIDSFGKGVIIDTYISKDDYLLYVKVNDSFSFNDLILVPEYVSSFFIKEGEQMLCFRLDPKWHKDLDTFRKSKYKQLSPEAKKKIYKYSGLTFLKHQGDNMVTDIRIAGINRSQGGVNFVNSLLFGPKEQLLTVDDEILPLLTDKDYI